MRKGAVRNILELVRWLGAERRERRTEFFKKTIHCNSGKILAILHFDTVAAKKAVFKGDAVVHPDQEILCAVLILLVNADGFCVAGFAVEVQHVYFHMVVAAARGFTAKKAEQTFGGDL